MFVSNFPNMMSSLARSESEIEINFARHVNGDKVTTRPTDTNQEQQKNRQQQQQQQKQQPKQQQQQQNQEQQKKEQQKTEQQSQERKSRRSFTTQCHIDIGNNSQEDSEGSSITDLRQARRSRSLDTLDYPKGVHKVNKLREVQKTPYKNDINSHLDPRISFHSSLQDLSSDDQSTKTRHRYSFHEHYLCGQQYRNQYQSQFTSEHPEHRKLSEHREHRWDILASRRADNYQIFMQKPLTYVEQKEKERKEKEKRELLSRPPTALSFRSSLNLLSSPTSGNRGLRQQVIVSVSSSLAPLACGFSVAYVAAKSDHLLTPPLHDWAYHVFILGATLGAFLSGVASKLGRKIPLFLCMSLLMLGWIAIIFSTQAWVVLLFHGLSGGCCSLTLVIAQIYVAEISVPSIRGALSSIPLLCLHIGILLSLVFGNILAWKNLAIVGVSLITPFFVMIVLCLPESPRFLIHKNPNEALAMLQWLRGFNTDVMEEYRDMADNCCEDGWSLRRSDFRKPSFWRPLLTSCALMFLYIMSGIGSITLYGQTLFLEMSFTYPNASYIMVASISIIGIIISSILVDQVGRKLLLLLSLTIMAASAFALGLFLFLKDIHKVQTYFAYQWSSEIFCLILFILAHGSALAPISWITLGEVFGTRLKWVGISLASMVMWSSLLLVDLAYRHISVVMATGGLFWFHCILCVGGYTFILLSFRELRHHKMDDVEKVFLKKNDNLINTFITKI